MSAVGIGDEDKPSGRPLGPVTRLSCDADADDAVDVRRAGTEMTENVTVAVRVKEGDDYATVMLRPANARRLAAAILNTADEADGTAPLNFVPATT